MSNSSTESFFVKRGQLNSGHQTLHMQIYTNYWMSWRFAAGWMCVRANVFKWDNYGIYEPFFACELLCIYLSFIDLSKWVHKHSSTPLPSKMMEKNWIAKDVYSQSKPQHEPFALVIQLLFFEIRCWFALKLAIGIKTNATQWLVEKMQVDLIISLFNDWNWYFSIFKPSLN